jgi:hypothetical protein
VWKVCGKYLKVWEVSEVVCYLVTMSICRTKQKEIVHMVEAKNGECNNTFRWYETVSIPKGER